MPKRYPQIVANMGTLREIERSGIGEYLSMHFLLQVKEAVKRAECGGGDGDTDASFSFSPLLIAPRVARWQHYLKKLHKLFVQQKGSLILLRTFMILFGLFKVTHIPSPLIAASLSFFLSLLLESA
jgi:hypothetical protein